MNVIIMTAPPRLSLGLRLEIWGPQNKVLLALDPKRDGSFYCAKLAFDLAVGQFPDQPVTILQDDIQLCRNFTSYVTRTLPGIESADSIVKWFDVEESDHWLPVLNERSPEQFSYTQAVTYSSNAVRLIQAGFRDCKEDGKVIYDDQWIRHILSEQRRPFFVHCPSIVQHTGVDSLALPGMTLNLRTSPSFIGTDFDVMTWSRII